MATGDLTSIFLCANGECRAKEFIEDGYFRFDNDGTVHYVEFIEGNSPIHFNSTAFYAVELLERAVSYLTDESDVYLTDESGNRLTTII